MRPFHPPRPSPRQLETGSPASRPDRSDRGSVTVGVDGHTDGWNALDWAAAEASVRQCELRVVHVIRHPLVLDPSSAPLGFSAVRVPLAQAHRVLDEAARRAQRTAPDVCVVTSLEFGSPAARLSADHDHSSLLVLGGGLGCAPGARPGRSVAARAIRRSRQPVVLVRLSPAAVPGPSAGRVVIVLRAGPKAPVALDEGLHAADARGVGVTVLHPADRRHAVAGLLRDSAALCPDADVRVRAVSGSLPDALAVETTGAPLTVLELLAGRLRGPRRSAEEHVLLQRISSPVVATGPLSAPRTGQ
jgi:nucleotide-binding universal stress UspA family protein